MKVKDDREAWKTECHRMLDVMVEQVEEIESLKSEVRALKEHIARMEPYVDWNHAIDGSDNI